MSWPHASPLGPVLFLDAIAGAEMRLSALFITARGAAPPPVATASGPVPAHLLADYDHASVWRARFSLPADRASDYGWNGARYEVAGDLRGDLRLAYVSCNGEEEGDLDRPWAERNVMWQRLAAQHRERPFSLLLHGGDQVYADEVTRGHPLSHRWPRHVPARPDPAALDDLRHHLREGFLSRYAALYAAPDMAWLAARVPSLMQWDDHDICDGWGSLRRHQAESAVGKTLFSTAREAFLTFQQAAAADDLPARFNDPQGGHLGWSIGIDGLRILAPDLRTERTRRAIMGAGGWAMMTAEAADTRQGHTFLMSSVPLLGPRLSLVEALMMLIPRMQKYEDDLRDQWQSRAHRQEWRRMLALVRDMALRDGHGLTALSGEIHLATRAVMDLGGGRGFHQLVASGIAHRAPPAAWARFLGLLAALGADPLPGAPIRIEPLPGQRARYLAQRNYLVLERRAARWKARWDLELGGLTPPLPL